MQENFNLIIADTSCLILLSKIEELELLNLMSVRVFVTAEVKREFGKVLPVWIREEKASDSAYQRILQRDLDIGEASSIALALEKDNSILIIDELKGRRVAKELSLRYSGTLGLFLKAKQLGVISSVQPIIEKVRKTSFRVSEVLLNTVLKEAGEFK